MIRFLKIHFVWKKDRKKQLSKQRTPLISGQILITPEVCSNKRVDGIYNNGKYELETTKHSECYKVQFKRF